MTVYDAICTIFLEDAGTLFITNEHNDFIGVCSRKDLLRASMIGEDIHTMPISVNMSRMPNLTYLEEETYYICCRSNDRKEIDSIPIVKIKVIINIKSLVEFQNNNCKIICIII